MKKFTCAFLTCCLLLWTAACGGPSNEASEPTFSNQGSNPSDTETFGTESDPESVEGDDSSFAAEGTAAAYFDTWENAYGESGPVEYEYIEIDLSSNLEEIDLVRDIYTDASESGTGTIRKVSKMTLKTEAGDIWRVFEFEYHYNSAVDLFDKTYTYNADDELLYSVTTYYQTTNANNEFTGKIVKNYSKSYDDDGENICSIYYNGTQLMQFESSEHYGYDSSTRFCVFAYDSQGRKLGAREYLKDGTVAARWDYVWEEGVLTSVYRNRMSVYEGKSKYMTPEFDSEGRLAALYEDNETLYTFTYDAQGRLTERTGYITSRSQQYHQTFIYGDDGSLKDCVYED